MGVRQVVLTFSTQSITIRCPRQLPDAVATTSPIPTSEGPNAKKSVTQELRAGGDGRGC